MSNRSNNDRGTIKRLIDRDTKVVQQIRQKNIARLEKAQPSPVEAQIAFIKELTKDQKAADAFLKDPKQYAVDHGVLLTPEVVKKVSNAVLYDVVLDKELAEKLGPNALKDIVDLREGRPTGTQANALAAAAAAAALVMAAAAVVTMVVTLVRMDKPADLVSLQGLGKQGVTLPNNKQFIQRDAVIQPNLNLTRNITLNNLNNLRGGNQK